MTDPKATGPMPPVGRSAGTAVDEPASASEPAAGDRSSVDGHPGPPPAPPADRGTTSALTASAVAPSAVDQYAALAAAGQASPAHASTNYVSTNYDDVGGAPVASDTRRGRKAAKSRRRPPDRAPRRARLQLRHLNVWSVLKFSCVLALALLAVWMIMIAVLYGVLDHLHAFSRVNETVRTINGDSTTKDVVTSRIVFYGALIIGAVNMVLFIILSTIGALVYNLCADLVGGIEVTLAERD